jgi:PAS domain-containing protein
MKASERGPDLPERREWEAELEPATRATGILQSVFDGVVTVTPGGIVEFNPAAERAFGTGARCWADALLTCSALAAREEHRQALTLCLASGGGLGRKRPSAADGTEFPAEISFTAVQAEGRRFVTAACGTSRREAHRRRAPRERAPLCALLRARDAMLARTTRGAAS